jgi:hypothetical protein
MTDAFPPSLELTRLYEKTSTRGTRYLVGRLGSVRVAILPGAPGEDGNPTWRMLLQAAPPKPTVDSPPQASAPRARRSPVGRFLAPALPSPGPLPDDGVDDLYAEGGEP